MKMGCSESAQPPGAAWSRRTPEAIERAILRLEHASPSDEIAAAVAIVQRHGWKDWNSNFLDRERSLLPTVQGLPNATDLGAEHMAESVALGGFLYDGQLLYPEIVALFELYILLRATPPMDPVKFTFASEYVHTAEDAASCLTSSIGSIADKVRLYNHTFVALTDGQGVLQRRLRRDALCTAWQTANVDTLTAQEKGVRLEQFADLLLADIDGLMVVEKNLRTQTAELDLVVQNNVARPFWSNLGSPLIFVECKNWTKAADVREARALESKMRARGRVARMSIFLSVSGFTKAFTDHVASLARDDLLLVSIQGEDVGRLIGDSKSDTTKWLETIIATQASGRVSRARKKAR
ncbi:restriction endonuclease [Polyangium sp. 6x1]|uniref:restriction endonuclease n=1 Tax=Polyangium sp. 6x1 TaxID=3042689 RepID=UPI002482CF4E|nr:restriction endonuclease [Polyangium sp. 6x1]MDI1447230.1 restriction endonuclease [Polyangium sp. 6x1]